MLVFIDESGYPLPGDSCLRPVVCAVWLPKENCRTMTAVLFNLKKTIFGIPPDPSKLIEIHGRNLLNKRTFQHAVGSPPHTKKIQLLDGVLDATENIFLNMGLCAVIMERPTFKPHYPEKHIPKEYVFLLQRINLLMEQDYPSRMATLIFDEKDLSADMKRAFAFGQFFFTSTEGRSFTRILDTPLFVASQTSPGLQMADLFASAIRLYNELNLDSRAPSNQFENIITKYYLLAKTRTKNFQTAGGQKHFGFYEMPTHLFPKPPLPE